MLTGTLCLQSEEYLQRLGPVLQKLAADLPDASYNEKSLAELVAQIQQFQEELLGKDVSLSGSGSTHCPVCL
jgi:hypothetical protein